MVRSLGRLHHGGQRAESRGSRRTRGPTMVNVPPGFPMRPQSDRDGYPQPEPLTVQRASCCRPDRYGSRALRRAATLLKERSFPSSGSRRDRMQFDALHERDLFWRQLIRCLAWRSRSRVAPHPRSITRGDDKRKAPASPSCAAAVPCRADRPQGDVDVPCRG